MCRITCMIMALIVFNPLYSVAGTIDVNIKGVDDGVKTSIQQDYREAVLYAKREAIERAGVKMHAITTVKDLMVESDYIESTSEAVLKPGYTIMDIGYQNDGTYLIILIGKVKTGMGKYEDTKPEIIDGDKRYDVYNNGVIKDRLTGNEWYIGSDVYLTWYETKTWIEKLEIDDGGWRMPTILELKTLYEHHGLLTHLPKVFRKRTTKSVIWSSESDSPTIAKTFLYHYDSGLVKSKSKSTKRYATGFAIR